MKADWHEVVIRSRPVLGGRKHTEWQHSVFAETRRGALVKATRWVKRNVSEDFIVKVWSVSAQTTFYDLEDIVEK